MSYFYDCKDLDTLKKKYRKFMLDNHPDTNPDKIPNHELITKVDAEYQRLRTLFENRGKTYQAPKTNYTAQEPQAKVVYKSMEETIKIVREQLKKAFPNQKFSVRKNHYSTIAIKWTDGPTEKQVREITREFIGRGFDGMTDSSFNVYSTWNGEKVHWASDWINPTRYYSKEVLEKYLWKFTQAGFSMPFVYESEFGNYIKTQNKVEWADLNWSRIRQEIEEELSNMDLSVKDEPKTDKSKTKTEKPKTAKGFTESVYKGHPTLTANGIQFAFGLSKAEYILEHLDEIREFVKTHKEK